METQNDLEKGKSIVHRYVDILSDAGFKAVFGDQRNSDVLIDLINVLLPEHRKVRDITYMTTELPGFSPFGKSVRLDLRCKGEDGTVFMVEVQCYRQANFFRRCVLYAAKTYDSSSTKGNSRYDIPPVYFIGLLGGQQRLPSENVERDGSVWEDRYVSEYTFREKQSQDVPDETIMLIFAELERFDKKLEECGSMREKWLYALKHVGTLESLPDELRTEAFERLFCACEISRFESERKLAYEDNMITERDYYNIIDTAKDDGIAIGEVRGEARGKAEGIRLGEARGKAEVARSLKGLGVPLETIMQATGMGKDEIAAL